MISASLPRARLSITARVLYAGFQPKVSASRVQSASKPTEVRLWQATNPKARDFRLDIIGKAYTSTVLQDQGGGVFVGKVDKPAQGWTAYFVEMTYPSPGKNPFKFTTGVRVAPEVLPFGPPPERAQRP